jgi:hypothetical protein
MHGMAIEESCKWSGEWFVKQHHSQCYCSKECRRLADQKSRRLSDMKRLEKKKKKQEVSKLSIHDMVDLMMKMEKEQGKVVQYGDLQTMLYNGQLKEKDGVVE